MLEWNIGDVRIRAAVETMLEVPAEAMIDRVSPETVAPYLSWLQPDYLTEDFIMKVAIQSILVESAGTRIVVDTCFGNDRELPYPNVPVLHTDFLDRLAASGFPREEVDTVLCTHLHFDHVGWNTMLVDGTWVPTFPNATYLFGQDEYAFWQDHDDFNIDLTDNVGPVVAAGLQQFVGTDHRITDEVWLEPTPGHSPGHVSVRVESKGDRALISGDMIHHPVQFVEQTWPAVSDHDPERAVATRQRMLRALANTDVLLIGTHFAAPTAGYVKESDGTWSWHAVGSA